MSSTITSGTTLARTEDESKLPQVRDQATYDVSVADDSTIFRSTPMQSLKKGILCHAFWSLCFDEEEEDGISRKPEEQSTVVASLQGTALEEWQLQEKREKRAWLGLSFSDDADAMRYEKMGSARQNIRTVAKTNQSSKDVTRAPETIMISRVMVADKYMLAGETKYEMADDVASEVSLDFTEPHKEIKGKRIQIKKKPPKVIQTKTTQRRKKEISRDRNEVKNQAREESTVADTNSLLESSVQKTENSILAESKANTKESLEEHDGSSRAEKEKAVDEQKSVVSSTKEETSTNASSNTKEEKSKGDKKESKRSSDVVKKKDAKKTKSHTKTNRESPKAAQEAAKVNESIEDWILPIRFIPDFSSRELKLRAPDVSPETLRWKHAEESRWQYYGDPRQSRVDFWWKEKSRDVGSMRAVDTEARDPVIEEECYVYDSDSDNESYFDKYVSGPSLPSPEEAQEQALKLASECNNSKKTVRFPFRRGNRYDASDELNDFAEISDLGRPGRRLRFFTAGGGNESYEEQATMTAPEAKNIPQPAPTPKDSTFLQPVPPGVFKL